MNELFFVLGVCLSIAAQSCLVIAIVARKIEDDMKIESTVTFVLAFLFAVLTIGSMWLSYFLKG